MTRLTGAVPQSPRGTARRCASGRKPTAELFTSVSVSIVSSSTSLRVRRAESPALTQYELLAFADPASDVSQMPHKLVAWTVDT